MTKPKAFLEKCCYYWVQLQPREWYELFTKLWLWQSIIIQKIQKIERTAAKTKSLKMSKCKLCKLQLWLIKKGWYVVQQWHNDCGYNQLLSDWIGVYCPGQNSYLLWQPGQELVTKESRCAGKGIYYYILLTSRTVKLLLNTHVYIWISITSNSVRYISYYKRWGVIKEIYNWSKCWEKVAVQCFCHKWYICQYHSPSSLKGSENKAEERAEKM